MPVFDIDLASTFPKRTLQESSPLGGVLSDAIAKRLAMAQAQKQEGEAKYAERNALANTIKQELENRFYGPKAQAEIGLQTANANKLNTMTPLEAQELKLKNQFYPSLTNAQIENYKALSNYRSLGGGSTGGLGAGGKEELFFQNLVSKDNPQLGNDPAKIYEASNVLRKGGNRLSSGEYLNPLSPASTEALNRITKYGNTAQGLNQQRFASTLEDMFKIANEHSTDAFKFSGVAGKVSGGVEAARSQFGENSPEYENYIKFTQEDIPAIVTEIVRTSGAHSTDSQKAMAIQATLPIDMMTSPKLAKSKWDELQRLYKQVGKSISKGLGKTQSELNYGTSNSSIKRTVWTRDANNKLIQVQE